MLEAVCGKTPKDYESNAEAGRYRNVWVSVKVTAKVRLRLKSLQEEKGSFLQISLCTGTKSVDNILTKTVVIDVLCFILFFFTGADIYVIMRKKTI